MVRRHARHQRRQATRAQMLAKNMKRRAPRPEPAAPELPEPVETPTPSGDGFVGYHVEQNGQWFTLYDPDGEKVGASKRDEAEAWAQMPGED